MRVGEIMTEVASFVSGAGESPLQRALMKQYAKLLLVDTAGPLAPRVARPQRPGPRTPAGYRQGAFATSQGSGTVGGARDTDRQQAALRRLLPYTMPGETCPGHAAFWRS